MKPYVIIEIPGDKNQSSHPLSDSKMNSRKVVFTDNIATVDESPWRNVHHPITTIINYDSGHTEYIKLPFEEVCKKLGIKL